jgi:serine/threonine protein kinase
VDAVHTNVTLRQLIKQIKELRRGLNKPMQSTSGDSSPDVSTSSLFSLQFADLQLLEALDSGAYGEVHRGMWKESEVAIKVFHMGKLSSKSISSFKAEFLVMSSMRHPNVVLLMGACEQPRPCIVMEYMRGGSLHSVIHNKRQSLSLENTVMVAQDIGRGLQYLHSINILHRDLKSKNVLLSGDLPCQAKICDFGLAKVRQESATMTGNIGTVSWTAPEVLNNIRYHFAADIYSFGMTLVEMVSGEVPFSHMLPIAVVMAVAVRKEKPKIPQGVNQDFKDLILGCIEWNGDDRLTILQILKKLDEILPPKKQPLKRQQSTIDHNESLGVLYLTETASSIGTTSQIRRDEVDSAAGRPVGQASIDRILANMLQQEEEAERQRMIENDLNLAVQLQQKDYSFHAPLLMKEQSLSEMEHLPKVVQESHKTARKNSANTSISDMVAGFDRSTLNQTQSSKKTSSPNDDNSPLVGAPPPPPAPPPVRTSAPSPKLSHPKHYQRLNVHNQVQFGDIIRLFPKFKLRAVETVEKGVARVGRVIPDKEVRLHPVVRDEIEHFNKRSLHHVVPPERPALGKVVASSEYIYPPTVTKSKNKAEISYYPKFDDYPVSQKKSVLKSSVKNAKPISKGPPRKSPVPFDNSEEDHIRVIANDDLLDFNSDEVISKHPKKKASAKKVAVVKPRGVKEKDVKGSKTSWFSKKGSKASSPPDHPEMLRKKEEVMDTAQQYYQFGETNGISKKAGISSQQQYKSAKVQEDPYDSDTEYEVTRPTKTKVLKKKKK